MADGIPPPLHETKMIRFPRPQGTIFKTMPDYGARMLQANHTLHFQETISHLPAGLILLLAPWSPVGDSAP